jgi:acetyl/propionyl-CoA carboxylase alpha subunit
MSPKIDWYAENPLVHRDRRLAGHASPWVRSFACDALRVLIVCRGPIRKEAIDVFTEMGAAAIGILLSEKDSIVYPQALAPELRRLDDARVHRVKDYTGASKAERVERVAQLVEICRTHGYQYVFAGYGFMAEDEDFVRALEDAGLTFMGPRSSVQGAAGKKDEAKRTALRERVSVTPGIDDATTRTLLRKYPSLAALRACAAERGLAVTLRDDDELGAAAAALLSASYAARVDLFSTDELAAEIARAVEEIMSAHPGRRVRLKAIGGGGGKGQRILAGSPGEAAERAPKAVREILGEVKANGVGDDKNMLLELNVEQTRHNEIQLLGNGRWCIALGGRDCSLQMHEQKLLEVSITQEELAGAIDAARAVGQTAKADALAADLATLARMEEEAERFGLAVGLNSASTFECIVEGAHHYFMEVNTRIQVEHRVTELCYALRFANPDDPSDVLEVTSLVEAMALIAMHGERLPRPTRAAREGASVEARLNATDRSLSPHAGGVIVSWSPPVAWEVRDDQGICVPHPDSGLFMHYRLAGAYDSNVALLVTAGDARRAAYERLCEILRRTRLRGNDLKTNREFHYGLVHWFLARDVYARPTTRFVVPYLTLVGELHEEAQRVDLGAAWAGLGAAHERRLAALGDPKAVAALRRTLQVKETLVRRPLGVVFDEPHMLAAWLSRNRGRYRVEAGRVRWQVNPLEVLRDTYWLLDMDYTPKAPAAYVIWDHDHALLTRGLAFYENLAARLVELDRAGGLRSQRERSDLDWEALCARLAEPSTPEGFDAALWARAQAAHAGFQLGLELLDVLCLVGERVGFEALRLEDDLTVSIPERLLDPELQARMKRVLVPPPAASQDEVLAVSGGMFYAQEGPDRPPFVAPGGRFKAGDPLYMIEVMKMFNTVYASFSGTVEEVLVTGAEGIVVRRGQPLFRVRPDERVELEDSATRSARIRAHTKGYVETITGSGVG